MKKIENGARSFVERFNAPRMTIPARALGPCLRQCRIGVKNVAASRSASRSTGFSWVGREQLSASNSDD
ncbi:hypothetical protein [Massilia violaceinigra]|uniref:hypothetical protein n=1 Tax=Massilia violaceinigra TaxID=2045208 RepID=UPI0012FE2CC3|nr:hypothetical protein [Massilia violaceinigra]